MEIGGVVAAYFQFGGIGSVLVAGSKDARCIGQNITGAAGIGIERTSHPSAAAAAGSDGAAVFHRDLTIGKNGYRPLIFGNICRCCRQAAVSCQCQLAFVKVNAVAAAAVVHTGKGIVADQLDRQRDLAVNAAGIVPKCTELVRADLGVIQRQGIGRGIIGDGSADFGACDAVRVIACHLHTADPKVVFLINIIFIGSRQAHRLGRHSEGSRSRGLAAAGEGQVISAAPLLELLAAGGGICHDGDIGTLCIGTAAGAVFYGNLIAVIGDLGLIASQGGQRGAVQRSCKVRVRRLRQLVAFGHNQFRIAVITGIGNKVQRQLSCLNIQRTAAHRKRLIENIYASLAIIDDNVTAADLRAAACDNAGKVTADLQGSGSTERKTSVCRYAVRGSALNGDVT